MTRFWHPFADMGLVEERGELVLERGEGSRLWDEQGRSYIDATAALWYCNVGYGREEIGEAVCGTDAKTRAYSAYADLATRPAVDLAERSRSLAPLDELPRLLHERGAPSRSSPRPSSRAASSASPASPSAAILISRQRSYHGVAGFGTSLAGADVFREGIDAPVPGVVQVPWDSAEALLDAITEVGAGRVAAFFCER